MNNNLQQQNRKIISLNKIYCTMTKPRNSLLLLALPCLGFVIVFNYIPLFGWIYAFFDYRPGVPLSITPFVGLKFFKLALDEPELIPVLRNTLALSFLGLLFSPLGAIFAILLYEIKSSRFKKIVQTTTTLPNFISWIMVYAIFFLFFAVDDGLVNKLFIGLGLIKEPMNLLGNVDAVWIFQTLVGVWKGLGFGAIIYLAAISGIDQEMYDAAKVDGAGRFRCIVHITVPGLIPTYITLLLLSIGGMLSNGLDQYYVFYNSLVHDKIQVLDYYVYRIGILNIDYAFSTALGMTKTLVSIIILFSANWISKRLRGQSII